MTKDNDEQSHPVEMESLPPIPKMPPPRPPRPISLMQPRENPFATIDASTTDSQPDCPPAAELLESVSRRQYRTIGLHYVDMLTNAASAHITLSDLSDGPDEEPGSIDL